MNSQNSSSLTIGTQNSSFLTSLHRQLNELNFVVTASQNQTSVLIYELLVELYTTFLSRHAKHNNTSFMLSLSEDYSAFLRIRESFSETKHGSLTVYNSFCLVSFLDVHETLSSQPIEEYLQQPSQTSMCQIVSHVHDLVFAFVTVCEIYRYVCQIEQFNTLSPEIVGQALENLSSITSAVDPYAKNILPHGAPVKSASNVLDLIKTMGSMETQQVHGFKDMILSFLPMVMPMASTAMPNQEALFQTLANLQQ